MLRNKHKRNLERVAVVHWLFHEWWLLKESFVFSSVYRQVLLFHFSRTTEHQPTRNPLPLHSCLQFFPPRAIKYHKIREHLHSKWPTVLLFLTTFTANLLTALSSSCSAWSILPIGGFETSLQTWWYHFSIFELTPRLLPTFKAWLLSTPSFCFNGEGISTSWRVLSDNLEKSDQKTILS